MQGASGAECAAIILPPCHHTTTSGSHEVLGKKLGKTSLVFFPCVYVKHAMRPSQMGVCGCHHHHSRGSCSADAVRKACSAAACCEYLRASPTQCGIHIRSNILIRTSKLFATTNIPRIINALAMTAAAADSTGRAGRRGRSSAATAALLLLLALMMASKAQGEFMATT